MNETINETMKVLIVYAHPEPDSLNGALKNFSVDYLRRQGHQVQVSDLYAMQWKASLDGNDSLLWQAGSRFDASADSKHAYEQQQQSPDITAEQEKLLWADVVLFQFPLWWFSMPAIMKGWIERVYACGFAYGVGEHSDCAWGRRYGDGNLAGKRAMLMVTTGGWESHYSTRGINGAIDDILFPIQHGILFYPGFSVLPPHVIYRAGKTDSDRFQLLCDQLSLRLDTLASIAPIPFRKQNSGDYSIPELELKPELAAGASGLAIHLRMPD